MAIKKTKSIKKNKTELNKDTAVVDKVNSEVSNIAKTKSKSAEKPKKARNLTKSKSKAATKKEKGSKADAKSVDTLEKKAEDAVKLEESPINSSELSENMENEVDDVAESTTASLETSENTVPDKKKLLFVSSEVLPFAATGGLGEVIGSLPKALADKYDVRVMMPYYSDIPEKYRSSAKYLCNYNVGLGWRNLYCGLFELKMDNVTYYFIDNEYYFCRGGLYGFFDDAERYAFFCKAVMDSFYFINFTPDIIHANDWQTALISIYNNCEYHYNIKHIFTIHNIEYQGQYDLAILGTVLGLPPEAGKFLEYEGCINLVKGAIETSDYVTTVSETYSGELQSPLFAHGLEDIIQKNHFKMRGILNGIDTVGYDPSTDSAIPYTFTATDFTGKAKDKSELQNLSGLNPDNVPVIAIISRLVEHKGLDLITYVMEEILNTTNIQLVVLGKGDRKYEDYFLWLQDRYRGRVSSMITYDKDLSRKVYAGADMLLMPSKAEPCGLSQMIACRYGTVPIVRETGGLKDSIQDCTLGTGTGFTFADYNANELKDAIYRAITLYYAGDDWDKLRKYIATVDFSWKKSASKYSELYDSLFM